MCLHHRFKLRKKNSMNSYPTATATNYIQTTLQRNKTLEMWINVAFSVSCLFFVLLSILILIRCYQRHKLQLIQENRANSSESLHHGIQNPDYLYQ